MAFGLCMEVDKLVKGSWQDRVRYMHFSMDSVALNVCPVFERSSALTQAAV